MRKQILSNFHKEALKAIGNSELSQYFLWSGGTALAYKYLQHRESYDLDFMSYDLLPDDYLLTQIKGIADNLSIKKIKELKKFNRHEFWITKNNKELKLEFVFYPFQSIKKPKKDKEFNVNIDSIEDILTNKIHAAFERSEPKDIFDLYFILTTTKIKFLLAIKWVEKKFGTEIDPVLLISKILEGVDLLGEIKPLMFQKKCYNTKQIKSFFNQIANQYLKIKIPIK